MSNRRAAIVGGFLFLFVVAGCNRGPQVEFVDVTGTVRINGQPKRGIMVRFSPDAQKGNGLPAFAVGVTDDQGKYSLHSEFQGKEGTGAPAGWNRVTVIDTTVGYAPQGTEPKPSSVPLVYSKPSTTPLIKEVKASDPTIDLDITGK